MLFTINYKKLYKWMQIDKKNNNIAINDIYTCIK